MIDIINKIPIKPYFHDKDSVIYNTDCRNVLPYLEDKSIDITLTDFPYGIDIDYGEYQDTQENLVKLIDSTIVDIQRISKRTMITTGVKNMYLYPKPDWVLAWFSTAGIGRGKWGFCCWQPILTYGNDPYLENRKGSIPDIFSSNESTKEKKHPCSKPENLWQKVLNRGSYLSSDIVLDPFMGSGTTLVVSKKLGRKSIGIELSEKYCKIAVSRLAQSVMRIE
jgi:site-specific DNA-methyltransferase (adenine-specific)